MTAPALTPELQDLMEHEKVIEQGLHTFLDVGYALAHIRDGKKYRAAGYENFESYCQGRWQLSRARAYQLIDAAEIADGLSTNVDIPEPRNEAQVRPLAKLGTGEERQLAWT